jgi:hypothetical protein
MTLETLQKQISECIDLEEADEICWNWLRDSARDNGNEGSIAIMLMNIIQSKLMP